MKGNIIALKYYLCVFITAAVMFGAHWLPAFGSVTEYGATALGIFIGLIFGFATIGLIGPSFLAMISLGLTEYGTVSVVIKDAIGNNIILFTIGVLILSATLEETGVTQKIVYMLASSKATQGKPWMLTAAFFVIAYIAALFLNVIIPSLLLWTLVAELSAQVGYKPGDKWPMVMYFGIVYIATAASFILPFQIGVIANFGMLETVSAGAMKYNALSYIIWACVCSVLIAGAYWILVRYVIKPDVSLLKKASAITYEKKSLSNDEKLSIGLFLVLVVLLIASSLVPEGSGLSSFLGKLETSGLSLMLVIVVVLLRRKNKPIFDFSVLFSRGMAWDIILMLSTIFLMVSVMTDASTGIPLTVQELFAPHLSDVPPMALMLVSLFIVAVVSNVFMNAAVSCTLIPIIYMMVEPDAFNMILFVALLNFIGGMAFMLPCSSGSSALLYSRAEWISKKHIMMLSFFASGMTYLICVSIGIPLGSLLFG